MRLGEVIAVAGRLVRGSPETEITGVVCDSRRVVPGVLFCAVPGVRSDGAVFAREAVARGAAAVLSQTEIEGDFPLVVVDDARLAMALSAAQFHRMPAARLTMAGVTGTNGKTTVTYLVDQMARAAARRTGLIGTVEWRVAGEARPSTHTTPESTDLQALLADMVAANVDLVAMEVSSHALAQSRVAGVRYRAAAFTQLTRDHLDYHGTMEAYFEAKQHLFTDLLARQGVAVVGVGVDDGWSEKIAQAARDAGRSVWRYGIDVEAELCASNVQLSLAGFTATWTTPQGTREVRSPLVGMHNVLNALAATGLALACGIPLNAVVDALAESRGAPGRLEPVVDAAGRRVFVDYAHTDDALGRVLDALNALRTGPSRAICVFGCGGDRDRGKRPLMGRAAAERCDVVVVTSDNPRTERPGAILEEIVPGVEQAGLVQSDVSALAAGARGYVTIEDRAQAIAAAVQIAQPGDFVLIAGKGHEDYQIVGTEKRHFDDREVAREALRRRAS